MASPRRRLFTLIFYTSNRQGIDWMCESALEKRLGTTFRLMEWDQASASWRTVGGRATPAARRARLAAGRGAERRRKCLPSCSTRSRSASRGRREYRARNRCERLRRRRLAWPYWRCGPPAPFSARGLGSCTRRGREWSRRVCERSAASRTGSWTFGTPVRYPIQAASYMLPGFDESPRLGFQALCAIARWLGSRHEQTSVCECLGDAVATTAAWGRSAVGAAGPAADPEPLERGGDR